MVNEKGEVLLVQEKWLRRLSLKHWKLPGGHTEKGVYIDCRERLHKLLIMHSQNSLLVHKSPLLLYIVHSPYIYSNSTQAYAIVM